MTFSFSLTPKMKLVSMQCLKNCLVGKIVINESRSVYSVCAWNRIPWTTTFCWGDTISKPHAISAISLVGNRPEKMSCVSSLDCWVFFSNFISRFFFFLLEISRNYMYFMCIEEMNYISPKEKKLALNSFPTSMHLYWIRLFFAQMHQLKALVLCSAKKFRTQYWISNWPHHPKGSPHWQQ